ncbi:uncharacterized protein BDZ99DRAFT_514505 [Mytilinidion resinicola]|uniref:Tachykinin family protein n=1 Tax=Mytilinidion resinicola TaxID=574789 RepID=A0A6A6Z6K1_9PEZI|nr:uncharacterized protein BDZ99DRAFT_514505 [Mytilinidion resinicola]KAF2815865.1 hypothetical protein BDZ99DRAFT_514505 [Mytilinidion resinicola]
MTTISPQFLVFDSKTGPKSEEGRTIYCSSKDSKVEWPPSVRRGRPRKGGSSLKSQAERSPKQRYEFVDCSDRKRPNDAFTRKLVRTHVMHDHRRQKRGLQDLETSNRDHDLEPVVELESQDDNAEQILELAYPPFLTPERWSRDPFDSFPLKMQPHMHELLYLYVSAASPYLYPIEAHYGLNPTSTHWVPLALTDPALLSSLLFSSEQFSAKVHGRLVPSSALSHLTQAVRILNERLQSLVEEIGDSTIAAVAGLALTEQASGRQENWRIHMKGIERMVEMRGGLVAFEGRPIFQDKLCRADICGSVYSLSRPYLQLATSKAQPRILSSYAKPERVLLPGFQAVHNAYGLDADLLDILYDTRSVTGHFNVTDPTNSDTKPSHLRSQIRSIQYRLLSSNISGSEHHLLKACRLGILLYTGVIQNEFWASPVSAQFMQQVRSCLGRDGGFDSAATRAVRLWLLFLAGAAVSEPSERRWVVGSMVDVIEELKLTSWGQVRGVLENCAWVGKVMDRGGEELWGELGRL